MMRSTGLARNRRVTYHCDSTEHRVLATDDGGRVRFAFGEFGTRPGPVARPSRSPHGVVLEIEGDGIAEGWVH